MKQLILDTTKSCLSLFRIVKNSKLRIDVLPKVDQKKLIILATGPSLKSVLDADFEALKQHELMAVNKFSTRKEFAELCPRQYVLLDTVFSTKNNTADKLKIRDDVLTALLKETTWDMNLFFPSNTDMKPELEQMFAENSHIQLHYFNMTTVDGLNAVSFFCYEKGYGMPFAGNVLVSALWLAINMGYKEIILAGADMSMHNMAHVTRENQLCLGDVYYYKTDRSQSDCVVIDQKVDAYFFKIAKTFEAFGILKQYAAYNHASIANSSMESYLDDFEKVEMSEILRDSLKG